MHEYGTLIWNIYLLHLYRSSRPLVPPTLTPAKWWAAWKPNTRGLSMGWPSQRSGILTTPWAQRSSSKTRSECVFKSLNDDESRCRSFSMNNNAVYLFFRLQRDWSWPLTQPSHQTQGKLFIFPTEELQIWFEAQICLSARVCSWVRGDQGRVVVSWWTVTQYFIEQFKCRHVTELVLCCIDAGYFHTSSTA